MDEYQGEDILSDANQRMQEDSSTNSVRFNAQHDSGKPQFIVLLLPQIHTYNRDYKLRLQSQQTLIMWVNVANATTIAVVMPRKPFYWGHNLEPCLELSNDLS